MAGTADIDDVGVTLPDCAVKMGVDKAEARRSSPVAKQARLDVLEAKRFAQQRIVEQVNLPDRQVVSCAPISVDGVQLLSRQTLRLSRCCQMIVHVLVPLG